MAKKTQVPPAVETPEVDKPNPFAGLTAPMLICERHGNITNSTLHLSFKNSENEESSQFLYCLHCLNEVLLALQKEGSLKPVQIVYPTPPSAEAPPAQ